MRLPASLLIAVFLPPAAAAAGTFARITSPVDGSRVSEPVTLCWSAADAASGYQLWLGTTPGTSDLLQTSETTGLTYPAPSLPNGVVIYARLWTRIGTTWRYDDVRFAVAAPQEVVLYDTVSGAFRLQRSVAPAEAPFDVSPGSRVFTADFNGDGLADVLTYDAATGEGHVRINAGDGSFLDRPYTWAAGWQPTVADLNGDRRADLFFYNPQSGAYLKAMMTPAGELVYTTGLWAPHWRIFVADFNADGRDDLFLYNAEPAASDANSGRWFEVLTDSNGAFSYVDGSPRWASYWQIFPGDFNGDHRSDLFLYDAASGRWFVALNSGTGFRYVAGQWTGSWVIAVGDFTGDGVADVFRYDPVSGRWIEAVTSPALTFTYYGGQWGPGWSLTAARLDSDERTDLLLYNRASGRWARVLSQLPGAFTYQYGNWEAGYQTISVPTSSLIRAEAVPTHPIAGSSVDGTGSFTWTDPPLARAFRLQIGTAPGTANLHDSGRIQVTERFVRGLPRGGTLYARLGTETGNGWLYRDFTFSIPTTSLTGSNIDAEIAAGMSLTARLRDMADDRNWPFGWTPLFARTTGHGSWGASCADYASALTDLLPQLNLDLLFHVFNVAFNPNGYDTHTLVEMLDPRIGRWALLDPTFAMTVRRTADGRFATAGEVSSAARNKRWGDLQFVALGGKGLTYAQSYYIDYPLLFLNVLEGSGVTVAIVSVAPYLDSVGKSVSGPRTLYAIGSTTSPRTVRIDGVVVTMSTGGIDHISYIFFAGSISAASPSDPPLAIYRPLRFVF